MRSSFLIVALLIPPASSCVQKELDEITPETVSITIPAPTVGAIPVVPEDLATIQKFAESYEPRSGREVIPSPPEANEKVLKLLSDFAASGSRVKST